MYNFKELIKKMRKDVNPVFKKQKYRLDSWQVGIDSDQAYDEVKNVGMVDGDKKTDES